MKIIKISPRNFNKVINFVVKIIRGGKVAVCPTDTVYGLLADATNEKAVKKVFKIKNRSIKKPLPVFIGDLKEVRRFAKIDKEQEKFLKKFWPGQVTIILSIPTPQRKRCGVGMELPKGIVGKDKKIGLRIPDHKLVNTLLKKLKKPLTGTSANISGKPASTKIKEIINQFKKEKIKPDLIIDAGNLPESEPSTVVDLTRKKPKILRAGKIKM